MVKKRIQCLLSLQVFCVEGAWENCFHHGSFGKASSQQKEKEM